MQINLSDSIATDIRNKVLRRVYLPGSKIPNEYELAEQYGVCRYTIREAIKKLVAVGLISVERGRGTFVNKAAVSTYFEPIIERLMLIERNVDEIFEARLTVEMKNASLAANHATPKEIERMHEIADEMYKSLERGDLVSHNQLDMQLHDCIAEAGRNRLLTEIMHILSEMIAYTLEKVPISYEKCAHSMQGHMRIISAIERHQPQEATDEMFNHLNFCMGLYNHDSEGQARHI